MKRLALMSVAAFAFLAPSAGLSASGDWNVFVSSSAVNRIVCLGDSIWCATRGGILIFNLADSTFVQHLDGLGFRSTDVSGVTRDQRGSVWASFTTSGVARIDRLGGSAFVKLYTATKDGLMSDSVTCIASVGEDVYYGSTNGVAKFYDNFHSFEPNLSDSLKGIPVNDLLARGDTLWVACRKGVALFQRSILSFRMFLIGNVTSLCVHDGAVHCAGSNGVQRFNGSTWVSLGMPQEVIGGTVISHVPLAVASGVGNLFCVAAVRVFRWSGSAWTNITENLMTMVWNKYLLAESKEPLRTIAVDSRGTPWVAGIAVPHNRGTYLSAYSNGFWTNKAPEHLSQNGIVGLALGPGHGIWASTRYFGISFRSREGLWTYYSKLRTPTDEAGLSYFLNHLALLFDSQGYLWCNAHNFDLDRIKINDLLNSADDEWTHYALSPGTMTSNRFVKAKEDPAGNRWFLSDDVNQDKDIFGINIVSADGEHWLSINPKTTEGDMAGGSVFDCAFGPGNKVYLALRGYGVQEWSTGGFEWARLSDPADDAWYTLVRPANLTSTDLFAVERGPDGAVWIGTASGLVRYKSGVIDSITVKERPGQRGILGAIVYDLQFDGAGNLWVATDQGLNKIDPQGAIDAFTTGDAWKGDLYPASAISPLPAATCTALQYDGATNTLWIGTSNGIASLEVSRPLSEREGLSRLILYPNPVHISRGDTELRISRIPGPVSIRVYTVEGELVHEIDGVSDGAVAWDLLTLNGFDARSGVYIVRVSKGSSSVAKKIGIIR